MTSADLTIGSERNVRHLSHSSEFRRLFQCDMREVQRLQSYQPSIYEWDRLEGGSSGGEINWITTNKTKSLGDKTNKIYDPKGGWTLLKGDRKKETDNTQHTTHNTHHHTHTVAKWTVNTPSHERAKIILVPSSFHHKQSVVSLW